jgi:hypothetical protein
MHRQIISNLAFSPTTMSQVSFYAKRLKQEESVRRLGLVLVVFSMLIQIFAAAIPTEKSVSASSNDVIGGGVKNLEQFRQKYQSQADVRALYKRFGIELNDITHPKTELVNFNFQQQGAKGTKTVGRINFASTNDHRLEGNFAGSTFYSRSASEWQGSTPAIKFIKQQEGTDGRHFEVWVLKDCGNIAFRPVDGKLDTVLESPKPTQPTNRTPLPTSQPTPQTTPTPRPEPEPEPEPEPSTNRKTAVNVTQGLSAEETPGSPVKANDVIEYSLITTNPNATEISDYVVEDYIGDLLDYADLDEQFLVKQVGTYDAQSKKVIWTKQKIPAKGELKNTFRVKVKAAIPVTNSPNATAPDYDCRMQNGYGNEIVLNVDCSVVKAVETLPNTGPGATIAIAVSLSTLSGYFFMRNRILSKEVGIIKRFYQTAT